MARHVVAFVLLVLTLLVPARASASALTLDFESFAEGDPVGSPFPGITFLNTMVLTAGSGINEFGANAAA